MDFMSQTMQKYSWIAFCLVRDVKEVSTRTVRSYRANASNRNLNLSHPQAQREVVDAVEDEETIEGAVGDEETVDEVVALHVLRKSK